MITVLEGTRQINIPENEEENLRMASFDISGISNMTFKHHNTGDWRTSYGVFENITKVNEGIFVRRISDKIES